MTNKESNNNYSNYELHPQGIMENKIGSICETIQNMEIKIGDLESKSEILNNSCNQQLNTIKAEKNQNQQLLGKLNSLKGIVEGLQCINQNVNDKSESLTENAAQSRFQLQQKENQQAYDMKCFEDNILDLAENFEDAPQVYSKPTIMETILLLKQEVQNRDDEMLQLRKELEEFESKHCSPVSYNSDLKNALNVFDISYGDMCSETKKLSTDLDKLNASLQNLRQELVMLKTRHA